MSAGDKPLVWLHGEIKSPPLSREARTEVGYLLRRLQRGETLSMPYSQPMPRLGKRCHEVRVIDAHANWRIIYRLDFDGIVIAEVFANKTVTTPRLVIETCQRRLKEYDDASR